jgi:hypothetical protein
MYDHDTLVWCRVIPLPRRLDHVNDTNYRLQCLFRKNIMAVSKRLRHMQGEPSGKCSRSFSVARTWYQGRVRSSGVNHDAVYHGQYSPE